MRTIQYRNLEIIQYRKLNVILLLLIFKTDNTVYYSMSDQRNEIEILLYFVPHLFHIICEWPKGPILISGDKRQMEHPLVYWMLSSQIFFKLAFFRDLYPNFYFVKFEQNWVEKLHFFDIFWFSFWKFWNFLTYIQVFDQFLAILP